MNTATFEESKWINASPAVVYNLLADYKNGHPTILPKPYFTDLRVVEGGIGAGTVIDVDMEVFGVKRTLHMEVTEPEKGRVIVEADHEAGTITHLICDPVDNGCLLTIRTTMQFGNGVMGFMEKLTTPRITRSIYRKELELIAERCEEMRQPA